MTPEPYSTITAFRRYAAKTAVRLKTQLLAGEQIHPEDAFWLEKAASKFSKNTPLEMCQALIDQQALEQVTKRLKS